MNGRAPVKRGCTEDSGSMLFERALVLFEGRVDLTGKCPSEEEDEKVALDFMLVTIEVEDVASGGIDNVEVEVEVDAEAEEKGKDDKDETAAVGGGLRTRIVRSSLETREMEEDRR